MGLLDKLKRNAGGLADTAADTVADNADKVDDGIDKVADAVDEKTGRKHTDKIDKATGTAKGLVDKAEDQAAKTSSAGPTPPTVDPDA